MYLSCLLVLPHARLACASLNCLDLLQEKYHVHFVVHHVHCVVPTCVSKEWIRMHVP